MENPVLPPVPQEKILAPIPVPTAGISPHAAAWEELQMLQSKGQKSSIVGGLVLLLVSLFVFAGTGAATWTWQRCALIIGVLFVHEIGHYVAMRWFKYRELRMFFIPLFGAAVTGRHFNVPGWKKAIVSLMGPLPGILIGAGLAVAGVVAANDTLVEASMLVIGLNLFNLLPILPLDGGWFWNAMLFCRHRWLEAGFQAVAGLVCLAASTRGFGEIWIYLGIVMLMKVPKTLRLGAIASRLRRERWQPGGDDFVSAEMAETLFQELATKSSKAAAKPKAVATEALAVFEKMNASPPNWLESFGLSALYGGAIIIAVLGLGFAGLSQRGMNQAGLRSKVVRPVHVPVLDSRFDGKGTRIAPSTPLRDNERQSFLYATYREPGAAAASFSELRNSLQPNDSLLRFGQTLVATTVSKHSNREHARQMREKLSESGNLIVTGEGYSWAQFDIAFTVADEATAKALYRELDLAFRLPGDFQPAAPWDQTAPAQDNETMLNARATYLRVVDAQQAATRDEGLSRRQQRIALTTLFRRNTAAAWEELAAERRKLERKAVERLQQSNDPTLDREVLALMLNQAWFTKPEDHEKFETWQAEMRRLLTGNTEPANTQMDPEDGDTYTERVTGAVELKGNRIILTRVNFAHADRALADLATWLTSKGFADVRYGVYDGAAEFRKERALASK